jgi:hypothetical protein
MKLIKYRDAGMSTYTYFWKNEEDKLSSPFFDTDTEAMSWLSDKGYELADIKEAEDFAKKRNYEWDEWKAIK